MRYRDALELTVLDRADFRSISLSDSNTWLKAVITPPVAAIIEDEIKSIEGEEPEFEPLLFDLYLSDAVSALDRCLSLRREIQDIEYTALSYARQYERFFRTHEVERKIEDKLHNIAAMRELGDGFLKAATLFKVGDSPTAGGVKEQSVATANFQNATAVDMEKRNNLALSRLDILKQLTAAEEAQHSAIGSALNFAERRERLLALLKTDLIEVYKKSISLAEGIRVIYGAGQVPPIPKTASNNILDALTSWIRLLVQFFERLREREIEFDLIVPIVQPTKDRNGTVLTNGGAINVLADGQNGMQSVNLRPWLDRVFGEYTPGNPRLRSIRLVAIGASISTDLSDDKDIRSTVWNLIVFPPETARTLNASMIGWQARPPILLGDVRSTNDNGGVVLESGVNVRNQNIYGEWKIRVLRNIITGTAAQKDRAISGATDIKLHLRLIGIPLNDHLGW